MKRSLRGAGLALLAAAPLLGGVAVLAEGARAAGPSGPDTCLYGFVWREARSTDHVCVTPATRTATAIDNSLAASRRSPTGGAYGPDTCKPGYVWREAFTNDHVCVTPATRTQAAADNAAGPSRRAIDSFSASGNISDGADVSGNASLTMTPAGGFALRVHLNNQNPAARYATVVCAVKLLSGKSLLFETRGDIPGKWAIFRDNTVDWNSSGTVTEVARRWAEIPRGGGATCKTSTDLDGIRLAANILVPGVPQSLEGAGKLLGDAGIWISRKAN